MNRLLMVALGMVALGILVLGSSCQQGSGSQPQATLPANVIKQIEDLRAEAFECQTQRQWREAEKVWKRVQRLASPSGGHDSQRYFQEAKTAADLCARLCDRVSPAEAPPREAPQPEARQPSDPRKDKPIAADQLIASYPVGKQIRSVALLQATGNGTNRDWLVFQGDANFAYHYEVTTETTVQENTGTQIVFLKDFKRVQQLRALSKFELRLARPESPILAAIWQSFEEELRRIPGYVLVRELIDAVDPGLKILLTSFAEPLAERPDVQIAQQIEQLEGLQLEITYVSGVGVTKAVPVNADEARRGEFSQRELTRIAHQCGLLMDVLIGDAASKPVGAQTVIDADDVGGILNLHYDLDYEGQVTVRYVGEEDGLKTLSLLQGEIAVAGLVDGEDRNVIVQPTAGSIHYSPADKLVRRANVKFAAKSVFVSRDHLLFGTRDVKNLKVQTYYEAEVAPSKQGQGQEDRE